MSIETTNIYVLIDPRNNLVRYVGKANRVNERYRAHLNKARKHQTYKWNWIQELKRYKLKPIIQVIDEVPIDEWQYWEIYWISQMKQWGFNLVNHTSGGDGCTFANQTSFKKGVGGKKVIGYDKFGVKKFIFNTAEEASKYFNVNRSNIPCCCSMSCRNKTVKGLAWFYLDDIISLNKSTVNKLIEERFKRNYTINESNFKKGCKSLNAKHVLMFDYEWNLIMEFESTKLAGKYIGVTGGAIQYACTKSKSNKCKQYKFKYKINYEGKRKKVKTLYYRPLSPRKG